MVAAGLPVPPGFHITTGAYRRYVEENHLAEAILSAVGRPTAPSEATWTCERRPELQGSAC